jgi:hypothetical protein
MENGKAVEDLTFTAVATAMHFGESGASGAELNHKYLYQSGNSGTTHQRYASRHIWN